MESDLFCFDLPVFDIHFVSDEADGNFLTDSSEVLVPFGHVLVGDSGADIEHDDSTLATDAKQY